MKGLHDRLVRSLERLQRGRAWCRCCHRSVPVDPVGALRDGWPRCCGAAMTIASPAERCQPPVRAGGLAA